MSRHILEEPPPDVQAEYIKWCETRPPAVCAVAKRLPPWKLYRMKSTGQRCSIYSFSEPIGDGPVTLQVDVTGEFNLIMFDRRVFGVSADDLEPCAPPSADETTGTVLTDESDIKDFVDLTRPIVLAGKGRT